MLNRRGPSGYEELKIDKTIYTPANVGQRFERITKYFEESGKNTPDLELYSQFIDMLWRNRQYEQALLAVRNAREKYPGSLYLLEKEGGILLDADFLDDAIDLFTKLKEEYSGRYEIFEDLGYSLLKRGKLDEAEKNLMEALEFKTWDPSHLMSQLHITEKLAQLYYKKEEYEKAMEFLEEILGVQPRSTKWQLYFKVLEKLGKTSELEEARITYERIKKARMYASRAQKYENQYKYELALKNYRKAVDENPYEPHYYFSIGNLLENLPEDEYEYQYEEATEYYRTATELFPNNPFYMMSYVGNLITIQEWEQAFETAKTSAHKFPELMIPNLRYLSEVLAKESEYAQLLEELLELDEAMELSELRAELALVLKMRGENEEAEALFEEASEIYGRKISMFPYQWRNYYRRGSCFAEMYKLEDARKDLIEALELRGEFSVNVAEKLSDILYKLHYYEDARLLLEALILSNPQDYEYYGKMGMCFIAAQDFEKAFEAFNRSLGLNPYEPEYLYGAGVSAAHLNFTDDALDLIRDLLEFDDGFVEIVEKEPAFSDMENNDDFFALISEVKARRNNKISGENTGRETDEDSETEPGE